MIEFFRHTFKSVYKNEVLLIYEHFYIDVTWEEHIYLRQYYFVCNHLPKQVDVMDGAVLMTHSVCSLRELKPGPPIYRKLNLNAVKLKTTVGPLNLEMRELKRFLLNSFTTIPSPMSFSMLSIKMGPGIGKVATPVSY